MKTLKILPTFFAFVILQACGSTKSKNINYETFWVNSYKTQCNAGTGKAQCLGVYKGNDPTNANWKHFYAPIQGFKFKEGQLQKIRVKVEKLAPENIPADASCLKYTLLEVKEKKADLRYVLNGDWVLDKLNDKSIDNSINKPTLAIDLSKQKVSGNNSCNDYVGAIEKVTAQKLILGNIASTRKMCMDMNIATQFTIAANSVKTYHTKGNSLIFYNIDNKKVLSFTKKPKSTADYRVNDIWVATRIEGNPINRMVKTPRLEINIDKMMLMGNDGCNDYSGSIKSISGKDIEIGNIAATQKACRNIEVADRFAKALYNSKSYEIEAGTLTFFDVNYKEALSFLKAD